MDHSSAVPSGTKALAIATLVINLILIQPTFLILWKHGKRGILGWMYLQILCAIRIVANAIEIHDLANHKSSSTATIVLNSVGLSPLILAITGILHEAYGTLYHPQGSASNFVQATYPQPRTE